MQKPVIEQIEKMIAETTDFHDDWEIPRWSRKVAVFLGTTVGDDLAREFLGFKMPNDWDVLAMRVGLLQGIVANAAGPSAEAEEGEPRTAQGQSEAATKEVGGTRKVFVVHGHDEAAKEAAARFLEKLDLEAIILHEQASGGRTIIEKFEKYSDDVGFAVVLLTPDDFGNSQEAPDAKQPRARQNVVLELGYFLGRLTRNRVCALYKGHVELPSDIQGVVYVEMDNAGAWKTKLAQELVEAKCPINLEGRVNG